MMLARLPQPRHAGQQASRPIVSAWLLAGALLAASPLSADGVPGRAAPPDPTKVLGPEECGECHEMAHDVWAATRHARGARELARSEKGKAIAAALGIARVRRDPVCVGCHFTESLVDGQLRTIAGVACESCHGASADWIDIHADLGEGPQGTEDPEHRRQRIAASVAAGMRSPATLHDLVSACYSCHVIADGRVVDQGGHPTGDDFDLVRATQGEVRHNFLRGRGENPPASPERVRVIFVLGRLLDLEHGLRALAGATGEGVHRRALLARVAAAREGVLELAQRVSLPELERAAAAATALEPAAGGSEALVAAAEELSAASRILADSRDGTELAAIDPLLPTLPANQAGPGEE